MYPIHLAGPISGRRAYTDPISNAVANTATSPLEVRHDLALGQLDPKFLNVVLHETTHYTTFITPVGYVLGALMAAHTADPVGRIMDQDKVEGPARIMIQADVLSIYFTPILEGLALFSEFDALSGDSPVASTVSSIAFSIFCKSHVRAAATSGNKIGPYDFLKFYISMHRVQNDAAERKLALLGRSLSSDDGYLIGYLWVKALWRVLVSRCRKLLDTDLFMGFLIDYFFGDFQLAALLFRMEDALHEDGSLETYIMAIEYYVFGERLDKLVENVSDLVDQYERYAMKLAPGHLSTARDNNVYAPYHNFSEDVALRIEMTLAYSSIRSMHIMWPSFAAGRHILRLFVAPADVEIDEAGTFKAHCRGAEGLIEGATLEVARPISKEKVAGVGSIEALLLPRTFRVVICVFLGHQLIATIDALSGNINDAEAATACDRLSSYLALEAASVQIVDELHFRSGSLADQVHSKLRARAKAKAYEFFSNLALGTDNGVPQDENILREMDEGGVVQLLAEYPGQAEWLARLSLSVGGKIATFTDAASQWGVPVDEVKKWLVAINGTISRRCGKEAFAVGDKEFGLPQF